MFVFQDPSDEEFDPFWSREEAMQGSAWELTVFVEEGNESPEIGLKLDYQGDNEDLKAVEFFYSHYSPMGSLFYQDVTLEDFNGEIIYQEECNFCETEHEEGEDEEYFPRPSGGDFQISWKENGQVHQDYHHLVVPEYVFEDLKEGEH